jgi:ADP-heptose:LPS heptosyltransferase
MNLLQFIEFINEAEVLVACSTGPLHIASALGKIAIGLYAPMKPIFPQRWAPVGTKSYCLVIDKQCNDCKKGGECACILSLEAYKVHEIIESNF